MHVSRTPLAGSPIRIVNALNAHTSYKARLIDLSPDAYGARRFPEDLAWGADRDLAEEAISTADLVHFHHWFDFESARNPFGFDFRAALKPGAHCLMHWHSSPEYIARNTGASVAELVSLDIPQMVVAQYHEAYYPNACPVPLIVDTESEGIELAGTSEGPPSILFAPSTGLSAHAERWESKGRPEVLKILERLSARGLARLELIEGVAFEECQRVMSRADIVIDDVVTGSYHTTSLEALAMGKVAVAYLDSRTQLVLAELTGSTDLPIVNTHLDQLEVVLEALCRDQSLLTELGTFSRAWILEHHARREMISHYTRGYDELLRGGSIENPRYTSHAGAKAFLYRSLPDIRWAVRRRVIHKGMIALALRRSAQRLRRKLSLPSR